MNTTSLKRGPAQPAQNPTTTTTTSLKGGGGAYREVADDQQYEQSEAAAEARGDEQARGGGGQRQSPWLEGTPQFKSSEGTHFLRLLPFPGESNLIDGETGPLSRWWMRYTLYRVEAAGASAIVIPRPGENLMISARVSLFRDAVLGPKMKTPGTREFDLRESDRIVFLGMVLDPQTKLWSEVQVIDLPVSRKANPKNPNDKPKKQVGDAIRDLPRVRDDDPLTGGSGQLRWGRVFSLAAGRVIALKVEGKKTSMTREIEVKSQLSLVDAEGNVLPQFREILDRGAARFGSKPLEELLAYTSKADAIATLRRIAPEAYARVIMPAIGETFAPAAPASPAAPEAEFDPMAMGE